MQVTRKLYRRFEYVSIQGNTMGSLEIVKITSRELPGFVVYQFTRNHTVMEYNTGDYEGHVSTTTETVVDFPNYGEAMGHYASIRNDYIADTDHYRSDEPTHPIPPVFNAIDTTNKGDF